MNIFSPTDILLPQAEFIENWPVIACDQFTAQPEYWERVRRNVENIPSSFHIILPEAELTDDNSSRISQINQTLKTYLTSGVFKEYKNSYIYVERTLQNGQIRRGIVGAVDLEAYDYRPGSASCIRATERTVVERIPPRKEIRRHAPVELPHIILLCDDKEDMLLKTVEEMKEYLPKLYNFDLMEGGGHVTGWLVQGRIADTLDRHMSMYIDKMSEKYAEINVAPLYFAVGDGNHSLATAKACYEELKQQNAGVDMSGHPARYALVELENIHDESQKFEPIHRIVQGVEPEELLRSMKEKICAEREEDGFPVKWYSGEGEMEGTLYLDRKKGGLPVGILQNFLDDYLKNHAGEIDYIHDDDVLKKLAREEGAVGFLLPAIEKDRLFSEIISDGVLPRKTFSMGHAREKRYYMEARRIC